MQHKDPSEVDRLMAELIEARELIAELADPDPCWFDHHGYCQAHAWMATEPACPHGRAQAMTP